MVHLKGNPKEAGRVGECVKALLVSGIYPPDIGGPASYIPRLATRLSELGFEVHIISLTDGPNEILKEDFAAVHLIPRNSHKILRIFRVIHQLILWGKSSNFLFANGLYEEVAIASFLLRKKFVFKIVGDPIWERYQNSGMDIEIQDFLNFNLPKKFLIQGKIFKWSISRSSKVTTPSAGLAKVIQERYKVEKISVIANGVKEKNYIQNHNYEYDLVSVSRLVSWKRIELLISLSIKENLSLVVIGDGPERDRLFQQTQNGRNRIIFTGNLRSEGVHDYLKKSRVFALLSEYEGMSFSLLEAMMAGKRILTSDISGNNEVLGKSIFAKRVNPLDFESLVKAALELLPDTKENFSRERDAHAWAKDNFSESLQIEKMIRYCPGNSHD